MQVNHSLRRIASLSAFVLAISITSASQAGVIPWVYDAIFGPVHYRSYGYSPYAVSYARPVVIRSYAPAPYTHTRRRPVARRARRATTLRWFIRCRVLAVAVAVQS